MAPAKVQVRYIVNDVDAALAFYCRHLGFHEDMHPSPTFAMLSRGVLRLVLSAPSANAGGGQSMPDGTRQVPGGWNRFAIDRNCVCHRHRLLATHENFPGPSRLQTAPVRVSGDRRAAAPVRRPAPRRAPPGHGSIPDVTRSAVSSALMTAAACIPAAAASMAACARVARSPAA